MSFNVIAILVSLAMMLTGAGSDGSPAEVSRTVRISNLAIELNGQEIDFDSALRLGARTDGQKALFDIAVEKDGEELFPIQISANADRLAVASVGQAVGVSADALNALVEQAQAQMAGSMQSDPESQKVLDFMKDEFIPAYVGLIEIAKDPARMAEIKEKSKEVVLGIIDRGEGAEDTVTLGDDNEYAVTRYNYTIEGQQMFEVADAVYTCDEALTNYYNAMMKLYAMMPEESGLNGITSFVDFGSKLGMDMKMEISEAVSEADGLDMMDAVLTVNLPKQMVQASEGEEAQVPELPPMVFNIAAYEMGENAYSKIDFNYEIQGNGAVFDMTVEKDASGFEADVDLQIVTADEDGNSATLGTLTVNAGEAKTSDDSKEFTISYEIDAGEQGKFSFGAEGTEQADGIGDGEVEIKMNAAGLDAALYFNVAVTGEPIADSFDSAEITMIEDLSEEGLQALTSDEGFQGKIMQVVGRFMQDAQKVMTDGGVQTMMQMFAPSEAAQQPAA